MLKISKSLLFLFVLLPIAASAGQPELKAAAVLGLTGDASFHSDGIRKGIELAREDLERRGWKVSILFEDDQTNPAKTVSAIHSLVARGYGFIIGPTWSYQVNAARPVIEQTGVVAMVPGGSSDINGGAGKNIFNLCPPRTWQKPVVEKWLRDNDIKSVFILTPAGDWGEIHRLVFAGAANDAQVKIAGDEQFNYGADAATIRALLLRARTADAVMITGAAGDAATIVRARNDLGLKFAVVSTQDVHDAVRLNLLRKDEISNRVWALAYEVDDEFEKRYRKRFGEAPKSYSDRGFDALFALAAAVEAAAAEKKAVRSYLSSKLDINGASGRVRFDTNGDLKDGTYVIVEAHSLD